MGKTFLKCAFSGKYYHKYAQEDHLEDCVEEFVEAGDVYSNIDPHIIRFCQDSISGKFRNGEQVTSKRRDRSIDTYDIDVVKYDGSLWALNNRSLYAARHFHRKVEITIVDLPEDWEDRFTTDAGDTPR